MRYSMITNHNPIQVLKPFFRTEEVLEEIRLCLEKGWTGMGYKTEEFEEKFKEFTGLNSCHFLNSATSGLHLAFNIFKSELGWHDGDEIITTSLTFVSTNHAILYENLTPVFADVDESLCLDPKSIENLISKKTKAIVYVGLGGNAANYKAIAQLCIKNNLTLILDAAHMAGTRWLEDLSHVGTDADCVIFSFQAVKNLPTADAGAICFKDSDLDLLARKLSWLGIDKSTFDRFNKGTYNWKYDVDSLGFKYHGNSIMAAMALVSLRYIDSDNQRRRDIAKIYSSELDKFHGLEIIQHDKQIESSRHLFQICIENRDEFMEFMAKNLVFCGSHYLSNHNYQLFEKFQRDAKQTNFYSDRLVTCPIHVGLSDDEIQIVISTIAKYFSVA